MSESFILCWLIIALDQVNDASELMNTARFKMI